MKKIKIFGFLPFYIFSLFTVSGWNGALAKPSIIKTGGNVATSSHLTHPKLTGEQTLGEFLKAIQKNLSISQIKFLKDELLKTNENTRIEVTSLGTDEFLISIQKYSVKMSMKPDFGNLGYNLYLNGHKTFIPNKFSIQKRFEVIQEALRNAMPANVDVSLNENSNKSKIVFGRTSIQPALVLVNTLQIMGALAQAVDDTGLVSSTSLNPADPTKDSKKKKSGFLGMSLALWTGLALGLFGMWLIGTNMGNCSKITQFNNACNAEGVSSGEIVKAKSFMDSVTLDFFCDNKDSLNKCLSEKKGEDEKPADTAKAEGPNIEPPFKCEYTETQILAAQVGDARSKVASCLKSLSINSNLNNKMEADYLNDIFEEQSKGREKKYKGWSNDPAAGLDRLKKRLTQHLKKSESLENTGTSIQLSAEIETLRGKFEGDYVKPTQQSCCFLNGVNGDENKGEWVTLMNNVKGKLNLKTDLGTTTQFPKLKPINIQDDLTKPVR